MSVKTTLTMLVSMTSMSAPAATATATAHLFTDAGRMECVPESAVDAAPSMLRAVGRARIRMRGRLAAASGRATRIDVDVGAHARNERMRRGPTEHAHAYRDALHDL